MRLLMSLLARFRKNPKPVLKAGVAPWVIKVPVVFEKPKRAVKRVFLHCSASDVAAHDSVVVMDQWHRKRGFSNVGYHFFIRKDGMIEKGRSLENSPAAQRGHNAATIAICLHGLKREAFTKEQYASLIALARTINQAYGGLVTFHGHCEVAPKECPVFDYKKVLALDAAGHMQ